MDKGFDLLGSALIFSILDANQDYWKIEIDDVDLDKTALIWQHWMLVLSGMPFRLCNTPGTFQWTMDVIYSPIELQFGLLQVEIIIIFFGNAIQHILHLVLYCWSGTKLVSHWILRGVASLTKILIVLGLKYRQGNWSCLIIPLT